MADEQEIVHSCDWSSQPDLHIRCSGKWTTPSWKKAKTGKEGVYRDGEGDLYTFEARLDASRKVTCPTCIAMIERGEGYRDPEPSKEAP